MYQYKVDDLEIGQLAELLGLTTQGVRYYEQKGLYQADRNEGNQRKFSREEIFYLTSFRYFRQCGMTMQDSQALVEADSADQALKLLKDQIACLETKLNWQQQVLKLLRDVETQMEELGGLEQEDVLIDYAKRSDFYFIGIKEREAWSRATKRLFESWAKKFPAVQYSCIMRIPEGMSSLFYPDMNFGLGVFREDCGEWDPVKGYDLRNYQLFPEVEYLHIIYCLGNIESAYKEGVKALEKNKRIPTGAAIIQCPLYFSKKGNARGYSHLWLPYREGA